MTNHVLFSWEVDGGSAIDVIKLMFPETEISGNNASLVITADVLKETRFAFSRLGINFKELDLYELNVS
ncbi:hypothetical protein HOF56_04785 [Candidatus Peribacteria bacterium]|jgi:hypothetical protein|nr:hypothetical protein [Candidatus Peribacteria bacterium]MBT4021539.1 hypothetical protein [Candidatus Peribacteria bacterium]MBT4240637.1 hypothetical protein [Candidatus Peribacteria bacterium]